MRRPSGLLILFFRLLKLEILVAAYTPTWPLAPIPCNLMRNETTNSQLCKHHRNVRSVISHPELVVVAGRTFLDKGTVVRGNVAVVTVLLQHVDLCLDLLLFLLGDIHHLYSSQLACLHMAPLRRGRKKIEKKIGKEKKKERVCVSV